MAHDANTLADAAELAATIEDGELRARLVRMLVVAARENGEATAVTRHMIETKLLEQRWHHEKELETRASVLEWINKLGPLLVQLASGRRPEPSPHGH